MSEQRLRLNENASLNILTRRLNAIYTEMVGKPLKHLFPEEISSFISTTMPKVIERLENATDFHLTQLLRLEIFEGRRTPIPENVMKELLRRFKENSRYNQAFADFKTRASSKLLQSAFETLGNVDAFKERANAIGVAELSGMKRIVTTESLAAVNWGREQNYSRRQHAEFDEFYWSIRRDNRTSPQCLEIARIVDEKGGSLKLQDLKQLIDKVAKEFDAKWQTRDWVPHYNCRSLLLRRVIID